MRAQHGLLRAASAAHAGLVCGFDMQSLCLMSGLTQAQAWSQSSYRCLFEFSCWLVGVRLQFVWKSLQP